MSGVALRYATQEAFVTPVQPRAALSEERLSFGQSAPDVAASGAESSSTGVLVAGGFTAAFALSLGRRRRIETRTTARAEAESGAAEDPVVEKEPFDVWKPSTYGNITMQDVKKYGTAGTLAYVLTELLFWAVAFPTEAFAFYEVEGHWPDFSKPEESAAVFGLVFAASNIARLMLPLRFGAALALAPWVDENIVQKFTKKSDVAEA